MPLRPATTKDIPAIQTLMNKLNDVRERHFSKQNKPFHAWPARPVGHSDGTKRVVKVSPKDLKKDIFIIAEEGNEVVGFVWGSVGTRPSHVLSRFGYIDELYVEEKWRRKRMAKKLVQALQKRFRAAGCDLMITKTDEENVPAQHFYAAMGMKRATVEFWTRLR